MGQRLLGCPLLGEVPQERTDPQRRTLSQRVGGARHLELVTVTVHQLQPATASGADQPRRGRRRLQLFQEHAGEAGRHQEVDDTASQRLAAAPAEQAGGLRVPAGHGGVAVELHEGVTGQLHHVTEAAVDAGALDGRSDAAAVTRRRLRWDGHFFPPRPRQRPSAEPPVPDRPSVDIFSSRGGRTTERPERRAARRYGQDPSASVAPPEVPPGETDATLSVSWGGTTVPPCWR